MNRHYFLCTATNNTENQAKLSELELPILIGGKQQSALIIPNVADDQLLAVIALDKDHAYIQPVQSVVRVFHNNEQLSDSAWLKSGDKIQIADTVFSWEIQGDRVLITKQEDQLDIGQLQPPKQPAASPVNDSLPIIEDVTIHNNKGLHRWVIAVVSMLILIVTFLLIATSVVINVQPDTAKINVTGFPPTISFGHSHLIFPGDYQLKISALGYISMKTEISIKMGPSVNLNYALAELPGLISFNISLAKQEMKLFVDGVETSINNDGKFEVMSGTHRLRLESLRYLPLQLDFEIEGYGAEQIVDVVLQPAWAVVSISSSRLEAEVWLDNTMIGVTPLQAEIVQGQHEIRVQKLGFKSVTLFRSVEAGQNFVIDEVQLQPVDGQLTVNSRPAGASILIGKTFLGITPKTVDITSDVEHKLSIGKTGYITTKQRVKLQPDEQKKINIQLIKEYGTLFLQTQPMGSTLTINGKKISKSNGRLRLQTIENTLSLSKPGYISKQITVTPKVGVSQNITITLISEQQLQAQKKLAATPVILTTAIGQTLELIKAENSFNMGASRREAGRRANESQRLVELQRPFYLAHNEVTNADFRHFMPTHDSGSMDLATLNGDNQPVVNVSWDDAARYANWLSKQQGLPVAYKEENGHMFAISPMTTGYRLPTEAEWAFVARRRGFETEQRYSWQGNFPPTTVNGNYADIQIADTLADIVPNYDDGYRGTAPVGSFPAWSGKYYDLSGNAAEWMHDIYAIYPGESKKLVIDPMGPKSGKHHVVRGASWRHGNITELRLSYRDYSSKPRYDLGFRLARYAE